MRNNVDIDELFKEELGNKTPEFSPPKGGWDTIAEEAVSSAAIKSVFSKLFLFKSVALLTATTTFVLSAFFTYDYLFSDDNQALEDQVQNTQNVDVDLPPNQEVIRTHKGAQPDALDILNKQEQFSDHQNSQRIKNTLRAVELHKKNKASNEASTGSNDLALITKNHRVDNHNVVISEPAKIMEVNSEPAKAYSLKNNTSSDAQNITHQSSLYKQAKTAFSTYDNFDRDPTDIEPKRDSTGRYPLPFISYKDKEQDLTKNRSMHIQSNPDLNRSLAEADSIIVEMANISDMQKEKDSRDEKNKSGSVQTGKKWYITPFVSLDHSSYNITDIGNLDINDWDTDISDNSNETMYTFGFKLEYELYPTLSLETGLQFEQKSKFVGQLKKYNNGVLLSQADYNLSGRFYSIPVNVKIKSKLGKKIQFYALGGVLLQYNLSSSENHYSYYDFEEENKYDIALSATSSGLGLKAAIGIQGFIGERLSYQIEPGFEYGLSPLIKNSSFENIPINPSFQTLGVDIGVTYQLTK